ncbi:MAG: 50S ribosomal protein L10 [Christensenellales bacterium]|jgi:large subunit ribosomal protein L10|nr:50S ribosomal protein L10 [Clostridiales bacterium]
MSVGRDKKVAKVADIKEKLSNASSFVLIDYKGLTVAQDTEMRNAFREKGVIYEVMKNRLLNLALKDMGYDQFADYLKGPTAVAMGTSDIAAPAKVALDKSQLFKKMQIKCGMVDGIFLDGEGCKKLAQLPSREGLISQILGLLQAPIAALARALSAIAEKQAEA